MNTDQTSRRIAQPAEEELKKHGDQLEKQVKDAAAKPSHDKDDEQGKQAADE